MLNRHKSSTEYNLAFQEVRPSSDNLEVRLKVFDQTGEVEVVARRGVARIQALLNSSHVTGVTLNFEDVRAVSEDKELFSKVFSLSRFSALAMFVLAVVLATVLDLLGTVHIVKQLIFRPVKGTLPSKFLISLSLLYE